MFIMTDYSLGSSTLSVKKAIELAVKKGYDKIVICDKNLSGMVEFYKKAKENKLMPIIALLKTINSVDYLFIAHNYNGYTKLTKADSLIDYDSLFQEENISVIAVGITLNESNENIVINAKYSSLMKEISIFDKHKNEILKEKEVLPIKIANCKEEGDIFKLAYLKCLSPQDPGYLNNKLISMTDKMVEMPELSSLSEDELFKLNTIIDKCKDDYKLGNPIPPEFIFGKEMGAEYGLIDPDNVELFEFLCRKGLKERLNGEYNEEYEKRLNFEMDIIKTMSFTGYMLIVFDFIKYAKDNKIPVGPGRGSAAGSLVCYSLYITNIDPMLYNLLFERFLNPERISLPDIDLDFCKERRIEVIKYVSNKYGKDRVAQVVAFSKIGPKSGIRDINRVLMNPVSIANELVKLIPETTGISCHDSYEENKEAFDSELSNNFYAREIWPMVIELEGFKKTLSIHAAGLVISTDSIYNRAPLYKIGEVNAIGVDGKYLEDLNLVKYDFLGLKNLTVIDKTVISLKKELGIDIDPYSLPVDNEQVFKFISKGDNVGLFQIESAGMRDLAKRLQPSNFEEIIAMIALFRPGPMDAGMLESFISRKHGREEVDYFYKDMEVLLKPILEPTYGLIVYQEQVMQIVQAIAGFSLGEADLVRRAMGKKKPEEMAKISKEFTERSIEKGFKKEEAEGLFNLIEKFAGYGFNKSHSAAYALVTYVTAYLKCFYPTTFITNLLNNDIDAIDKIGILIREAKLNGIKVFNPDVLHGSNLFIGNEKKKEIIFGLQGVKSVGAGSDVILKAVKVLGKNINIKDLLKYTQRDFNKEIADTNKHINRVKSNIKRFDKNINKNIEANIGTIDRAKNKKLNIDKIDIFFTEKELILIDKRKIENEDFKAKITTEEDLLLTIESNLVVIENELLLSTQEKMTKLNKTTLEMLGKIGAFDTFNITRKDILDNIDKLLNYNTIDEVVFEGKDIDDKIKIAYELDNIGLILTDPFKKDRDLLNSINLTEGFLIANILKTETKMTKKAKPYVRYSLLTTENELLDMNDFNGKLKKFEIGNNLIIQYTYNELKFMNILKCIDYNKENIETISYSRENQFINQDAGDTYNEYQSEDFTIKIFSDINLIPSYVKRITVLDIDDTVLMILDR